MNDVSNLSSQILHSWIVLSTLKTFSLNIRVWMLSIVIDQQPIVSHWADPSSAGAQGVTNQIIGHTHINWQDLTTIKLTNIKRLFYSVCCVMWGFLVHFEKCLTFSERVKKYKFSIFKYDILIPNWFQNNSTSK